LDWDEKAHRSDRDHNEKQAKPKATGQSEPDLAQLMSLSAVVVTKPSFR
jgi:hypothetical protein